MSDATAAALAALNQSVKGLTSEIAGLRSDIDRLFGPDEDTPPRDG